MLSRRSSDFPPLLRPGTQMTLERLRTIGVSSFPLSKSRRPILAGFQSIVCELVGVSVIGDLVINGSFLTEEIDPLDIDFTLCVEPAFYANCSAAQRILLEWIRDDFSIKETHLCDCSLCVEFPSDHPEYFDGIQNRAFWVDFFGKSKVYKRTRGVAILKLAGQYL